MIRIGDTEYAFSDPVLLLSLAGVFVVVLVLVLLIMTVRRADTAGCTIHSCWLVLNHQLWKASFS